MLQAQQNYIDSIKIVVKEDIGKGIKLDQNIVIPILASSKNNRTKPHIKEKKWDTTAFNPYKNRVTTFPFKIEFEDSIFSSPIKKAKVITSRYGWRHGRPHKGIDIDLVTGDSVVAILDGIVRFARYNFGHGKTVVIRHYNGLETAYAHLSEINVKPNDTIIKGQFIGKGGNTGRSTGSHLHLTTSYKGNYINPEYLFDFSVANRIRERELWVTQKWTRTAFHNSRKKSKLELLTTEQQALASLVKTRKVYIVKAGDTLSRISKRNNVSIRALCKVNAIRKTSTLKIGQKLIIEL